MSGGSDPRQEKMYVYIYIYMYIFLLEWVGATAPRGHVTLLGSLVPSRGLCVCVCVQPLAPTTDNPRSVNAQSFHETLLFRVLCRQGVIDFLGCLIFFGYL